MIFNCDSKYLALPASHHAQQKRVYFYLENKLVYDFVVSLDYDRPDYLFYLNVERFRGQEIEVKVDPEMELKIVKSDTGMETEEAYKGKYRPLAHFTVRRGWLNDPNGLVYYRGKYLMFYQHNPVGCTWENMHWGYAVSDDLMHWEEKDIALYPDGTGTMFSGSAIIDHRNLTGLKENGNDVILLFYTAAGSTSETAAEKPFTQSLAYSTDGGVTFRKYDKNPLIGQLAGGNRDPKVIYYEPADSYIMVFYLEEHEFAIYVSKNLLDWEPLQTITIPQEIECPDLYPLAVDGDADRVKWVFIGASDKYLIGSFDGRSFVPETEMKLFNYGNNSYAAQSWSDIPDGRRVRTSFATVVIPGMPFGSCMSIPQEMTLKTVGTEICLCAGPVSEISSLYDGPVETASAKITAAIPWTRKMEGKAYDILLQLTMEEQAVCRFSFMGFSIEYRAGERKLTCLDKSVILTGTGNRLQLRIVLDTVYAEIFVNQGNPFLGMTYIQDPNLNTLKVEAEDGAVQMDRISLAKLGAFWKR